MTVPGARFGRWMILDVVASAPPKRILFCRCDCGTTRTVLAGNLTNGTSASCGCSRTESTAARCRSHGESSHSGGTPEYRTWRNILIRCSCRKHPSWSRYGGRGIAVCNRWLHSFQNFLSDMGRKPTPEHSIDRINNDGNYEPSNCRWATRSQQMRNRRPRAAMMEVSDEANDSG